MNYFEFGLLQRLHDALQCDFLDFLMPLITKLGDGGIFCIAVAVLLLCFKKTRRAGVMMGIALLCGFVCGNLCLKNVFARTRPYDLPGAEVTLLVAKLSDYSFPSGHTLACFEMASVLMLTHRKSLGWPTLVIASAVAFSRLYLFVHYPTDVLAGALLGTLFGFVGVTLGRRLCVRGEMFFARRAVLREKKNGPKEK